MELRESGENYLETILLLQKRNGYVRSIDIARELNFSKPSVSRAMSILKKAELVEVVKDGNIILTDKGKVRADAIYERHQLITEYLMASLGVDSQIATEDACKIEHIISQTTFEKIKEFVKKNNKL